MTQQETIDLLNQRILSIDPLGTLDFWVYIFTCVIVGITIFFLVGIVVYDKQDTPEETFERMKRYGTQMLLWGGLLCIGFGAFLVFRI